ncbi:heavy metal translocating P-type ATPase [Heliophilum fasciatum]|uniref:Cd(2+)-exporting ATPase n=1 Tax=Heliophilum fasciatum TaxID=35700 RepID=A0A4R2RW58_9FIRM|nr:heavy metal translocating P-type ATPase [Heliophilum fasciatum]MCW2276869.1 Cd2+/Zn2+-exporting ATPase [Heliophilum fasciatum]TCP68670.1 Cd2+/Zn2+-exporting ATPase [Heliophilum fasciatum]
MGEERKFILSGLTCANCAGKIERTLVERGIIRDGDFNFAAKTVLIPPDQAAKVQQIIDQIEEGVLLIPAQKPPQTSPWRFWLPIGFAGILLGLGIFWRAELHDRIEWLEYLLFLTAYLLAGGNVVKLAVRNALRGDFFDERFLMTVATVGAFAIREFPEAVAVMLFYRVGEYIQGLAVNRSRRSIQALMNIRPDYANLQINGGSRKVSPEDVPVGASIIVKPGEKVPLDGVIIDGASYLDTSALTGESLPRYAAAGAAVKAGMVNQQGLLTVRVEKGYHESSVAKILDLVENAVTRKAPTEQVLTKFSRVYTPFVVVAALAVAFLPPLLLPGAVLADWIYRACTLLVISCPCALVISIPLGYFGGIGGASRNGILVKGANYLEALTEVHTVVFDKTGTITEGHFQVRAVMPQDGYRQDEIIRYAAMVEAGSSHPIAKSILTAYARPVDAGAIEHFEEIPGCGIRAVVEGKTILVGNDRLLHRENIVLADSLGTSSGTVVYLAIDGRFAGAISIADQIKADVTAGIRELKRLGVQQTIMLTGDDQAVAEQVAQAVGIDRFYAELLPADKVARLEELEQQVPGRPKQKLVFVGDGINDAPVLARADVGIAMGGLGSDAAIEAADVVIMEDQPSKIATAIQLAHRTKQIIMQNIFFAFAVKALFIGLGIWGVTTMWEAVFADVGVAILAVLNATRVLTIRPEPKRPCSP